MQNKVILFTTAFLLAVPAVYFFFFEFGSLEPEKRILAALFQSVTPRTAGFNTMDLASLSEAGQCITITMPFTSLRKATWNHLSFCWAV